MYTVSDLLKIEKDEGVAVLSLLRPLGGPSWKALLDALEQLKEDADVAGILVTGCSGEDPLTTESHADAAASSALGQKVLFALEALGKPVVAAAAGEVVGASLELALACDFIVAGRSAVFGFPAITRGEIPCFGGTQRLTRLIGKARAKELIFTGENIDAARACEIGLVNRVYEDSDLLESAVSMLRTICGQGTLAIRMAKEIIDAGYGLDLVRGCLMERDAFALCFATHDQREGMTSFLERRPAQFKGR